MWWNLIAGAASGMNEGYATEASINANNRISAANADAGNKVRQASNFFEAAKNNVARYVQSVNNNRQLEAGGKALEALQVNYRRARDQELVSDFSSSIQSAEQEGAAAAAQAAAGIGGSVVDMVNGSTMLRDSIISEQLRQRGEFMDFDAAHRAGSIMSQTIQGMDNSLILDTLDYNINVAQKNVARSTWMNALIGATKAAGALGGEAQGTSASDSDQNSKSSGISYTPSGSVRLGDQGSSSLGDRGMAKFSFNTESSDNPYAIWGQNKSLGSRERDTSDSIYSLWSR